MFSKFEVINGKKLRKKVRAVIYNGDGHYLLIQPHSYESDNWTLVGGGVEDDESWEEALRREILEETGISKLISINQCTEPHWFCFSDKIKTERNLDYDGQFARIFLVEVPLRCPVKLQTEEVRAHCWTNYDEALKRIKNVSQKNVFTKAVATHNYQPKVA